MKRLKCNRGQGVIEYLIIVAMMGVAAISIMQLLQHTTNYKFTQIVNVLQGKSSKEGLSELNEVRDYHYKRKDFKNFVNGISQRQSKE